MIVFVFFFSSRRRHTRFDCDWSSDVCSSDLKPTGVNPQLVWNVRRALDGEGFQHVKIVVSGGFTVEKIRQFEEQEVPVDMYGVGSSLFQGRFDFTADVVRVEGKPLAKVGRSYQPNPRLERVE